MSGHGMRYPQDLRDFVVAERRKRARPIAIAAEVAKRWPGFADFSERQVNNLYNHHGRRRGLGLMSLDTPARAARGRERVTPISLGGPIWSRPKRVQL